MLRPTSRGPSPRQAPLGARRHWGLALALLAGMAAGLPQPAEAQGARRSGRSTQPVETPPEPSPADMLGQLPLAERVRIQDALVWTGHYVGPLDGVMTGPTRQAIGAWQQSQQRRISGVLSDADIAELVEQADKVRTLVGWQTVLDAYAEVRLGLPLSLLGEPEETEFDGQVRADEDGKLAIETVRIKGSRREFRELFRALQSKQVLEQVTHAQMRGDWFLIVGVSEGSRILSRFAWRDGEMRGVKVETAEDAQDVLGRVALAVANSFEPFPEQVTFRRSDEGRPGQRQKNRRGRSGAEDEGTPPHDSDAPTLAATGSAVLIAENGYAVTNGHVVEGCSSISAGGAPARIVRRDDKFDLALIETALTSRAPARIRKDAPPELGEDVAAIGFPLRGILENDLNITTGIISALGGIEGDRDVLQITAPVQQGNSGGPLLDFSGRLIGIVASKLDALEVASESGDIPQNINFAIRPEVLVAFLDRARVSYLVAPEELDRLPTTRIAASARQFTLLVECYR